MYNMEYN